MNPGLQEKVTWDPTRYGPFNNDGGFEWPLAGVGSTQVTTSRVHITNNLCKLFIKSISCVLIIERKQIQLVRE